ncbi:serine/threonine/tyrosine-interacting protein A-like [Liolophura sinensis]|uniref:serine/threonine/tyrosine-interacting protein A-like n=1 Tax=Liolophura sinensis TaxID=3198878 RepID=UPI003157F9FA
MNFNFPPVPNEGEVPGDWAYAMRRDMQEILPGLYLGPYAAAMRSKLSVLEEKRITHIVCIRHAVEANFVKPNFINKFQYLVIDISDSVTENIIQHFPKVKGFLDECLQSGGRALVHGNAGISRSAALVIAYIMEKYGLCYKDAFGYVQQRRFCINPNEGFAHQLTEYEPIYKAKLSLQNGQRSADTGMLKRKLTEDHEEDGCSWMDT